jgi:uncharacterized protein YbjT (DUF2867 family)
MDKNSRILITGGSGLVGQNLTNRLVAEGYKNIRVHLHTRKPRSQLNMSAAICENIMIV